MDLVTERRASDTRYPFESRASESTEFFKKGGNKRETICPQIKRDSSLSVMRQAINTFMKLFTIGENLARKTTHRATLLPMDDGPHPLQRRIVFRSARELPL